MRLGVFGGTLLAFSLAFTAFKYTTAEPAQTGSRGKPNVGQAAKMPNEVDFGFVQNKGQWNDSALFYAGVRNLDVWVTKSGIKYDFYQLGSVQWEDGYKTPKPRQRTGHVVELEFKNSSGFPSVHGVGQREGTLNFLNADSAHHAAIFNEARLTGLYQGIDMRVYKDNERPRFDLLVAPGANPEAIKFQYKGAESVRVADNGRSLMVKTRFGEVSVTDLATYQIDLNGNPQQVSSSFTVSADGTVSFNVGEYDSSRPLVIDPVVYSTLFGGAAAGLAPGDDMAFAVAVDRFNQAYVTGLTNCPNFPVTNGAYDNSLADQDAFVTKFRSDASNLEYSTLVGGAGLEQGRSIAVDSQLRAVVVGHTTSPSSPSSGAFPTTPGAPQPAYGGNPSDGFVIRLAADGSALDFGTYLGGSLPPGINPPGDIAFGVGVDSNDNIFAVGQAAKADFPSTAPSFQPLYGGGATDGFVAKITPAGVLDYATFVGGTSGEFAAAIAVDALGYAHVAGVTSSVNFPTTAGSWDTSVQGSDAFVLKFEPTGSQLEFSTVIGGSNSESLAGIVLDIQGNTYITGQSNSVDFPRTLGAYDNVYNPPTENYVTKVALDGKSLVYSTFMNGGGTPTGISVDDLGVAHIVGIINDTNSPPIAVSANADQPDYAGPNNPLRIGDAFLQALNDAGTQLLYGSYWGGEEDDAALGVDIDNSRNAYVVGVSNSWTGGNKVAFPTTPGVFKPTMFNDNAPNLPFWDAFLTKFKVRDTPLLQTFTITPGAVAGTEVADARIVLQGTPTPGGATIRITSSNENVARAEDLAGNPITEITIPETGGPPFQADFKIRTFDVVQSFVVNFTAELEGDTKVASITVAPWLSNLTVSPITVIGGNTTTGRITLFRPAPAGGLRVGVTTSDVTKAFVASNFIDIPAGQTTANFDIFTRGVDAPSSVTVLSRIVNPSLAVTRSQVLQVLPANLKSLTFAPNRVNGGETSIGTLTLDGEAGPTPISATLSLGAGTAPITLPSPPTVTVATGQKTVTFEVTAGVVSTNSFRTISASRASPSQTVSGTLFVDAVEIASVDLSSTSVLGGTTLTGHVTITAPAAPGGFTVNVASSDPTYANLSVSQVTIPAGAIRSADFTITTPLTQVTQNVTITASKPGFTSKSAVLTVRAISMNLSANPTVVVGASQNVTGSLTLNEPAPTGGVLVSLSSNDTSALTVPNSVTIPEGQSGTTFTAVTKAVTSTKNVTITATVNTLPTPLVRTAVVTVNPLTVAVSLNPEQVVGGTQTSTGTVTISAPAGAGGVTITLSSTNTQAARVQWGVIIPQGQTTASFTINTSYVPIDMSAFIVARTPAGITSQARLTVFALRHGVVFFPNDTVGGKQVTGLVQLSAPAGPGGITIQLQNSNPSAASHSSSLRIAQGSITGTFNVQTFPVTSDTQVTVTATLPSGRQASGVLTVRAPKLFEFVLTVNPVFGGQTTGGRVTLDGHAPAGGINVQLSSSNTAVATLPSSVTVPAGQKVGFVTIQTYGVPMDTTVTLTAVYPTGNAKSAVLSVLAPNLVSLQINPSSVVGGNNATGTVTIDRAAGVGGITVQLSKDPNATGSPFVSFPATVVIPAGATSANFTITTTPPSRDVATTIFAELNGQQVSAGITIRVP